MHRVIGCLVAVAIGFGSLAAQAQTGGSKPTCPAGDTVVWENTNSKAYHLPDDKYYGKTKHGAYACRSGADSAGYHLAGGKAGSAGAGSMTSPAPLATQTPLGSHHGKHHHKPGTASSPAPSPSPP